MYCTPMFIVLFYYFKYYFIIFLSRPILDLKFPLMVLEKIALSYNKSLLGPVDPFNQYSKNEDKTT